MGIAHELITRGWTQGQLMDEAGRVCLEGALRCAGGQSGEALQSPAFPDDHAWRVLRAQIPTGRNVPDWNDAGHRIFDEVLRVAKQADEILGW